MIPTPIPPTLIPPTLGTRTSVNPLTPKKLITTTTLAPATTSTTTLAGGSTVLPLPTQTTTMQTPPIKNPDSGPPTYAPAPEAPLPSVTEEIDISPPDSNNGPPGAAASKETSKLSTEKPPKIPTEDNTKPPTEELAKPLTEDTGKPPDEEKTKPPTEELAKPPTEETDKPPAEVKTKPPTEELAKPPTEETDKPPTEEKNKSPAEEPAKPPTEETDKPPTEEKNKPPAEEAPKAPVEGDRQLSSSGPPDSDSGGSSPPVLGGVGEVSQGPPGSKRGHDPPTASAAEEKLLEEAKKMKMRSSKQKMKKKYKAKGLSQEEGDHFKVYITDDGDNGDKEEISFKVQPNDKHLRASAGHRDLEKEQRSGNYRKFHGNPTYNTHHNFYTEETSVKQDDKPIKPIHTLQKYIEDSTKEEHDEREIPPKKHNNANDEENTLQEQERIYKGETVSPEAASNIMTNQETEIENIYKTMHKQEHKFDRKILAEPPKMPRVESEEEKVFSSSMRQKDRHANKSPKETSEDVNTKESPKEALYTVEESSKGDSIDTKASEISPKESSLGISRKSTNDVFDFPDEVPSESSLDSYEKNLMQKKHSHKKPTSSSSGRADSKDDIVELLKQYGKLKDEVTELTNEREDGILPVIEYNGRRKSTTAKRKKTRSKKNY